jgi:hypothetical protein
MRLAGTKFSLPGMPAGKWQEMLRDWPLAPLQAALIALARPVDGWSPPCRKS